MPRGRPRAATGWPSSWRRPARRWRRWSRMCAAAPALDDAAIGAGAQRRGRRRLAFQQLASHCPPAGPAAGPGVAGCPRRGHASAHRAGGPARRIRCCLRVTAVAGRRGGGPRIVWMSSEPPNQSLVGNAVPALEVSDAAPRRGAVRRRRGGARHALFLSRRSARSRWWPASCCGRSCPTSRSSWPGKAPTPAPMRSKRARWHGRPRNWRAKPRRARR